MNTVVKPRDLVKHVAPTAKWIPEFFQNKFQIQGFKDLRAYLHIAGKGKWERVPGQKSGLILLFRVRTTPVLVI